MIQRSLIRYTSHRNHAQVEVLALPKTVEKDILSLEGAVIWRMQDETTKNAAASASSSIPTSSSFRKDERCALAVATDRRLSNRKLRS